MCSQNWKRLRRNRRNLNVCNACKDENNTYAKFSPSGMLSLTIANPTLLGKFNEGESYYLDFTKAN